MQRGGGEEGRVCEAFETRKEGRGRERERERERERIALAVRVQKDWNVAECFSQSARIGWEKALSSLRKRFWLCVG